MNKLLSYSLRTIMAIALAVSLNGCEKDTNYAIEDTDYSAVVCVGSWPNTSYYIGGLPSLSSGTFTLKGHGAEMTGKVYAQDIIQRNGFYYHANAGNGRFGKYHVSTGVLEIDREIPFSYLNWSSYTWVDDETLVIFGNGEGEARYAVVKVANMSVTTGKLDLSAMPVGFSVYNIGFAEYRAGKIFLGYNIASDDWTNYPVMAYYPKVFVAVIDYANMSVQKILEDNRSNGPGGANVYASTSFVDELGDIYFITDPVNTYDYVSPSVVYRIKSESTEIDPTYFFNFSATLNNEMGAAMWNIGNGKAVVRTRVAGTSIDTDHSFTIIDVRNGTTVKKLDLPADKGERMVNAVIVEDGKAFIAVNAVDKDYIWQYDPATDKLTHGLEFVGGIDYILRIEKLKK